jgi:hypothetical protein
LNEFARATKHAPKRLARRSLPEFRRRGEVWLPSRRWATTHGNNATTLLEDDDEDDYEASGP